MKTITVRIKGGLGNQLFCYSAARRLAIVNDAELIIDDVSGFARNMNYPRKYALDVFNISARKALPNERFEPFERYRRAAMKLISKIQSFDSRSYIEQRTMDFDDRILLLRPSKNLYLDGYWQSESYFLDVKQQIRDDLRVVMPLDDFNQKIAEEMQGSISVGIHVRWFSSFGESNSRNVSAEYYKRAIIKMEESLNKPRYYLFSDNVTAASLALNLPADRLTLVSHNHGDDNAYVDLWLMSKCKHFITANSTFSWWGAWLGSTQDRVVITPNLSMDGVGSWGFSGLIPDRWIKL